MAERKCWAVGTRRRAQASERKLSDEGGEQQVRVQGGSSDERRYRRTEVVETGYSNPTNGPTTMSNAVISSTQTVLMTSPAGSMSNIR